MMKSKQGSRRCCQTELGGRLTTLYPSPLASGVLGLALPMLQQANRGIHSFDMSSRTVGLAILLLLLALAAGKKHLQEAARNEPAPEHKTVVESNHFYSNYETFTNYDINSVIKGKSLIFLLKQGDKTPQALTDNPITITLQAGSDKQTCTFHNERNLCALKEVTQTDLKLRLECKKLPCELSWIILQPGLFGEEGAHEVDKLVEINRDYNHATMIASCNDPGVTTFSKDMRLYTNSNFTTIENKGVVYYLFDNEEKGYYFLTSDNEAAKKCASPVVKHSPDELEFNVKNALLEDFILPGKTNTYEFKKIPVTDFRIDSFFHTAKMMNLAADSGVEISLMGQNSSGQRKKLQSLSVSGKEGKNAQDLTAIFKKPQQNFKILAFDVRGKGKEVLVISMDFVASERQQVNLGETSYFQLKKGQQIKFKLIAETQEKSDSKKTYIFSSDQAKFTPSVKECSTKVGCEFTVTAKEDGQGSIYLGQREQKDTKEMVSLDFEKSVTKKVREGEKLLLKHNLKAKEAIQVVVNSPNVLIYAANKKKCDIPDEECHEKVLNSHNPIIYETVENIELVFTVIGLDNCEFTLTVIDEGSEFVELQDSRPFTYLFDDGEKDLVFKFTLTEKQQVNFNLIAPINELDLIVYNTNKLNEDSQGEISTEGYISIPTDQIDTLTFFVKVQKREEFKSKFIHFTLLVSTKQGNVRLQAGLAHYQTLPAEQTRDFVFEFEPKKEILLNFYTHNMQENVEIFIRLSTTDDYNKPDEMVTYTISSESQVFDIQKVAETLCDTEENCELFLRVQNKMSLQLDVTITLLIKDSIIELKDGIWNSFPINSIAKTNHFYFLPKHANKSLTIQYKSDFVDLKLMYSLWKTDDKSINPSEWPFPDKPPNTTKAAPLYYRPTQFVHIDSQALKNCWPNCVLLLSTLEDDKSLKNTYNNYLQDSLFRIMVSNNDIEIPQKIKIDIVLKKDEEKHLLIDLKYALDKNALTFFTYFSIGSVQLSANVYDQSNPRCPTPDEGSDFRFGNLQTQISLQTVKARLKDNGMDEDKNPYICILAKAYLDSKFSIEYTSDNEIIKQLMLDSFYIVKSTTGETTYMQVDGTQEFSLKATRTEGFPYVTMKTCRNDLPESDKKAPVPEKQASDSKKSKKSKKEIEQQDFETCLQNFKASDDKGLQLADKTTSFAQQPCARCILFIKVYSPQPSEMNVHLQSKYSETELVENQVFSDQVVKAEENKYLITSIKNEELLINIQIQHGEIEVEVQDFSNIHVTKSNKKGESNIHISIPPKLINKTENTFGQVFYDMFDYSTFNSLHLVVRLINKTSSATYTITYSSGDPEVFLQDGLITQYGILSNRTTKFLYKNPTLSKIYLHMSMVDAIALNKLKIKILAINDENDEDSGVEITTEKTNFKKKTPNPTIIMQLPANKFYQILVTSQEPGFQMLTIGVNNQQIIYLPLEHEFPIQLRPSDHIYLVVNVPYTSYIQVEFKKCDESTPALSYTLDYAEFIKEQFSYEQEMGPEELITQIHIKSKKSGSVYLKVRSPEADDTLLTVKASMSFFKNKEDHPHAGGKGLVEYTMKDAKNAQISLDPLVCPATNKSCYKDFSFSVLTADKVESVYAQLVCSSIAFDLGDRQIIKAPESTALPNPSHDGKITFTQVLKGDITFVGVKASNNKTGEVVYYRPVEIITLWGQMQKGTKGHGLLIGIVMLVSICTLLICYRRKRRNVSEYAPLSSLE